MPSGKRGSKNWNRLFDLIDLSAPKCVLPQSMVQPGLAMEKDCELGTSFRDRHRLDKEFQLMGRFFNWVCNRRIWICEIWRGYAQTGLHLDLHMDNLLPLSLIRLNTSLTFVVDRREAMTNSREFRILLVEPKSSSWLDSYNGQAEHNILMHPFHILGLAGVKGGSLFSSMHASLVTSSLIRESTKSESANEGINTMTFNLNGFSFNQSVVDSQGRVINTWTDIINRANLGMEVMHECDAHNFPLDLADIEAPSTNG
ncbi:hypothetical protein HAX54_042583 [Datura stramonium]|uniref:Uncharacterized protein n=1 Tax=Datura stramonium TaxID=4076 RepID=A0ABS8W283_DATST|nr:hypothetical protein [Datura stramonium]